MKASRVIFTRGRGKGKGRAEAQEKAVQEERAPEEASITRLIRLKNKYAGRKGELIFEDGIGG